MTPKTPFSALLLSGLFLAACGGGAPPPPSIALMGDYLRLAQARTNSYSVGGGNINLP
ncbi:hypothetical protein [Meiothermus taiwanensis]|jgi:hypothetical protein|uniref:Uncharacterized protein n=1 Tax=Meiothermus taiwanensis WR-220 TaxID=1339250 RepID=A0ABN5M0M9_9DEIN|nr:hypothetical protein [Meiothermus taiwanensis]AWR88047.1 hypothetical protein Mtai_v1c28230 [Meiothermus taiwanensis WR-220]